MKTCSKSCSTIAVLAFVALTMIVLISKPAHAAGPWYVAPGGSDGNSCLSTGSPCATINGAIGKASSGDTINVATGTFTASTGTEVVLINKNITLSGGWNVGFTIRSGSSTIDGQGIRKGIVINGVTAVISRFNLQNANFYAYGNGVNNIGGIVTLTNVTIRGNGATSEIYGETDGSGIYNTGTLTLTNSIVTDNTGTVIHNKYDILTLINSVVSGNTGIGIYNEGGALTLTNSTVSHNTSSGISGSGTLNNSTVSGNSGGGISIVGGVLTLNNSTVSSNTSPFRGGGIFNNGGAVTLRNSILAGNTAGAPGPDCNGTISSSGYNLIGNTSDCTFTPGAGDLTNVNAKLGELINSPGYHPLLAGSPAINAGNPAGCADNLANPLTTDQRGAARVGICDMGAYEYTLPGPANSLIVVSGSPQRVPPLTALTLPLRTAVLDSVGSPVSNTVVTFSAPAGGASGMFAASGTYTTTALSIASGVAAGTTFTANGVRGAYVVTATVSGIITPASFLLSNFAWYVTPSGNDGNDCQTPATTCATINGALAKAGFLGGDTVLVASGTYTSNTGYEVVPIDKIATLSGGWNNSFTTHGGMSTIDGGGARRGITVKNSISVIVDRFVVQNGYASQNGGGIYNHYYAALTLNNSTVSGNTAGNIGGGIYHEGYGTLTLNNGTVRGNSAAGGGGILNAFSTLTLNNSTVSGNTGGGIENQYGTAILNNSTVSGNTSSGPGGGIASGSGTTLTLNNSTVTGNSTSQSGGGISGYTGILQNSIVAGNAASGGGPDCAGVISSFGYNLIGNTSGCTFTPGAGDLTNANAILGELIGSPGYHPLLPGSPAINAGNPAGCTDNLGDPLTTDQRGALRVGRCDIGAYEYTLPGPANSIVVFGGSPQHALPLTAFALPLRAVVMDGIGSPVSNTVVTFFAPANGASGTFAASGTYTTTAVPNAGGMVTATTFTANGLLGSYVVSATVSGVITPARFLLSNSVWYVTPAGSDSNDCQTPATACATINGALTQSDFFAGDTVDVAGGTYGSNAGNEVVLIDKSAKLSGGWNSTFTTRSGVSIIDGGGARRGIAVNSGVTALLEHFVAQNGSGEGIRNNGTLTLNNSAAKGNSGWGIINTYSLTLNNSTVNDNIIGGGGGIANAAMAILTLNNSTIAGNIGAGIAGGGTITLNNSTISGNTSAYGGGIQTTSGTVTLQNSIVAGNTATFSGPDCYGNIGSAGYNLIGNTAGCTFTPGVGDLTNVKANLWQVIGSPGYYPLLSGSPAIDAGNPAGCMGSTGLLTTDQRGSPRPMDGDGNGNARCDVGAYELDPANPIRFAFLPIIRKPKARIGINGTVAENGTPATGVSLDLRFYNGSSWSTQATTTTDADGDYFFTSAPSLLPGQFYYVRYQNTVGGNPNRLWTWHTKSLSAFTAGSNVSTGNFDLANITLVSPANGATVSVPRTFQWTPRPATPSDTYEFDMYDPTDGNPYFYTAPPLGYVGSYTLNSLPPGFNVGALYTWEIWVYSPDGGFGISYETRAVHFSNTGLSVTPATQPIQPKTVPDLGDRRKR